MIEHYDRAGNLIDIDRWALLMQDRRYQVLVQDHVGPYMVSTVWLGIDHNFDEGPPLIFETMVFKTDSVEGRRYTTEEEALAGHAELLNEVSLLGHLDESSRSEQLGQ